VRWAAFFDAGRAWNELDALDGRGGGESDFSADAGLGIRIGELGFYWAYPLSGSGKGLNFFVRIGRRL
jgi:outer membrane translocation and assembly module TamA